MPIGGTACIDPLRNNQNCGRCGNACPAGATCTAGACACPTGQTLCPAFPGGPIQCTDTQSNRFNCGACGVSCGPAGNGLVCRNGMCVRN